ncbi:MAG: Maf-like protein [Prevotella sp.]|nr:Maf-like protein [Prevotellaceae bacterium]MDY3936433.1 Maf-like protein [Prevotella sp.]MDY4217794.1 Maf-like protein [Prevotella sp.]
MKIKDYNIILASNSPRRKELLTALNIDFSVKVLPDIAEDYPASTPTEEIALYISKEKANAYKATMKEKDLIITADTVVIVENEVLGKPKNKEVAQQMLRKISGRTHQVITGVCLLTKTFQHTFKVSTDVTFKELSEAEINYYIDNYQPYDKAGAYGIQEWIGCIGVTSLSGSYFNVMGLPVQRIWEEINKL